MPGSAAAISLSDFGVAFFAGLVVFPVIFAFSLQGDISESTLGTLFISLPTAFLKMGAAGRFVGLLFFVTLFVGALTSAISLLEVVTSSLIDNWRLDRTRAALGAGLVIMVVGIPSAYNQDILGLFDKIAGEFLLVVGAFFLALLVAWRIPDIVEEAKIGFRGTGMLKGWLYLMRFAVPLVLAVVIYQVGKEVVEMVASLL